MADRIAPECHQRAQPSSTRIKAVVRELAAAYVAVLRAIQPRFGGDAWDWSADN